MLCKTMKRVFAEEEEVEFELFQSMVERYKKTQSTDMQFLAKTWTNTVTLSPYCWQRLYATLIGSVGEECENMDFKICATESRAKGFSVEIYVMGSKMVENALLGIALKTSLLKEPCAKIDFERLTCGAQIDITFPGEIERNDVRVRSYLLHLFEYLFEINVFIRPF